MITCSQPPLLWGEGSTSLAQVTLCPGTSPCWRSWGSFWRWGSLCSAIELCQICYCRQISSPHSTTLKWMATMLKIVNGKRIIKSPLNLFNSGGSQSVQIMQMCILFEFPLTIKLTENYFSNKIWLSIIGGQGISDASWLFLSSICDKA